MQFQDARETIRFAGLTDHNNQEISERARKAVGRKYPSEMPGTSLSTALRSLERAQSTQTAWRVPSEVADRLDAAAINEQSPEDVTAFETVDGEMFIQTERFQAIYSPDKLEKWVQGEFRRENMETWLDALFHIPTRSFTIVNPLNFYEPLEQELRELELGDAVFGEIRTTKGGGEVHMELLFDCFDIELGAKASGGPILMGVRTGYDFFGELSCYAAGFAQDRHCVNSIRNVTDEKTRRKVGNAHEEVREWWRGILKEMELMTDQLAEMIEIAVNVRVNYIDMGFAELYDHADDLQAFYQLLGFPDYLAKQACTHVRSRAVNRFEPNMWELHSGATYAITHHYRGGENTSTVNEYIRAANDLLMNPEQAMYIAEDAAEERRRRMEAAAQDDTDRSISEGELADMKVFTKIEEFQMSIGEKKAEFETRQEQMRNLLADETDDEAAA